MAELTRETIFAQAAAKLRQDFEELRIIPHSATKGGETEKLVRAFLNDRLPKRFAARAGFVLDSNNAVSRQTDVIVYDALHCALYRASEDAAIIPNNNVAAVIEVKSVLDGDELEDALDKNAKVKALARVRTSEVGAPVADNALGCVFAFESKLTLETLSERYQKWLGKNPLGRHSDVIVVLDRGLISLVARKPGDEEFSDVILEGTGGDAGEGWQLGIGAKRFGEATLDAFFRMLLMHLTLFRGVVEHPGFGLAQHLPNGMQHVSYLTTITNEKDPIMRQAKLAEYRELARRQFAQTPVPSDWATRRP